MRRNLREILPFLLLSVLLACGAPADDKDFVTGNTAPFGFLPGEWEMADSGRVISEVWTRVNDSLYHAHTAIVSGDSVTPVEKIRLHFADTAFVYEVELAGTATGGKIPFTVMQHDSSGFTAVNSQNPFPKRIIYRRINPDSLQATIDDGTGAQRMDFNYSRKKRPE